MDRGHNATYARDDNHLLEYWEEYQKMIEETKMLDDYLDEECSPRCYDEGEEEAEWLRAAGLEQLTEAWKAGREVQPEELGAVLRPLSRAQAEAVKRRVKSLNHTVKQRFNQRQRVRKPDIRDVFKDVEVSSTGTRSRSATPDSLDSVPGATPENASPPSPPTVTVIDHPHQNAVVPNFVSIFHRTSNEGKATVRRTPSAPQTVLNSISTSAPAPVPVQEIFRRTGNWSRGDVANDSEGIQLTGYHRLGTIHVSRPIQRHNNGGLSDIANTARLDTESVKKLAVPKESTLRRSSGSHATVTRSHSSLYGMTRPADENLITHPLSRTSSHGHLSFEEMCRTNEVKSDVWPSDNLVTDDDYSRQEVELLSQRDLTRLQPLLWLELTAIFDKYNIPLTRRKPNKRRRKAGNLFGVSLSTLLLRDSQLTSEENNIPLVFQKIFNELTKRGVKEEGILRVGGHKQKVEMICTELETDFYCKPKEMDKLFKRTPCHDLSAVLKRLLRDLPQPLLTVELIDAFYQSHGVKSPHDLVYSLNLLTLLLPVEHRCTLEALLNFLKLVIENQVWNKMSIHNVAMIVAPSLFPPRYVHPRDRADLTAQVNMAAICCQVTEALLNNVDKLWYVPTELINQLRRQSEVERYRKYKKKYY
ncbi:rho GTPase-activating protein conundrum [Harpegnathos saltator]|uniref:Rho GTPase-activating protein 18 n=1 Tax=Harpegnathos saltator TaxID=610380 RepID=E2BYW3_HARSA|nr:rho GTPase-activating protein conundrum [Harpegnathos saltator]XP_011147661.1 rho GTPase-activating protein conundrum [Harpegnathos saltator]XP_011147663.1 rho GTPase-activating protein conundrum [Harpegnathos saltator]XP_011147664.1 rho GTPase-activating protein conundrum [Harpegnathos saltator]XP_025154642.1 rho GTPase-activating protein conundrum [Harpegnathos saltator]XP_025154643.1 rho GTPase-activating protein conundrum [Harpegnathos saltator]XP_025154645.1 rho GTPase-activating prot